MVSAIVVASRARRPASTESPVFRIVRAALLIASTTPVLSPAG